VADLARPEESYADVLAAIDDRAESLSEMASAGRTGPGTVSDVYDRERR